MGLFDLFGGGGSHSATTTSTNTVTNTQLAGGAIDAPVAYGTGNKQTVTINTIDPGAVAAMGKTSLAAIASGVATATDISQAAIALGKGSNSLASGVTNAALNFGTSAVGAVSRSNDTIAKFSSSALDTFANLYSGAIGAQATLTDQNLAAVSGLASQVSQSATQSVNDSVTKIVTIISIAAAAAFILKGFK